MMILCFVSKLVEDLVRQRSSVQSFHTDLEIFAKEN